MASCSNHGETEFLPPDANGNSYCQKCAEEWQEKATGIVQHTDKPTLSMGCHVDECSCADLERGRRPSGFPELDEALKDGVPKDSLSHLFEPEGFQLSLQGKRLRNLLSGAGRPNMHEIARKMFPVQEMPPMRAPIFMMTDGIQDIVTGKIEKIRGELRTHDGSATYKLGQREDGLPNITCRLCGMTSYLNGDIDNLYCGNCHAYHTGHGRPGK